LNVLEIRSFRAADCDSDHYLVVANVRERLAVNKQRLHIFHMERFNLKKLNEVVGKEPTRGGRSVGIVRLRTQTMEFLV
jgi:hypothetical protein